jgi:hypothetical protein
MKKALVTVSADPDEPYYQLYQLAVPSFRSYCEKWGFDFRPMWYDTIHPDRWPGILTGRQPEWYGHPGRTIPQYLKIPAIAELLEEYDFVWYMDSDCCILDQERNIEDALPAEKLLGFNDCGYGPFASVSLTRSDPRTRQFWQRVWECDKWSTCKWWDNAGVQTWLGYSTDTDPMIKYCDTEYTPIYQPITDDWIAEGKNTPGVPEPMRMIYHVSHGRELSWKIGAMSNALVARGQLVPQVSVPSNNEPPGYTPRDVIQVYLSHGRVQL